jgi:hypothetical protein
LFADNQVTLDLVGSEVDVFSSVLLASLDDVGVEDNQLEVLASTNPVFIELIALGTTSRGTGNRINATPTIPAAGRFSALFYGLATTVTANVADECIAAFATNPNWLVYASNLELAANGAPHNKACTIATALGKRVGALFSEYLLSM